MKYLVHEEVWGSHVTIDELQFGNEGFAVVVVVVSVVNVVVVVVGVTVVVVGVMVVVGASVVVVVVVVVIVVVSSPIMHCANSGKSQNPVRTLNS
jgi:ABC-type transport system involved in Fe-S cluster assembly fused permease/ATPase subunit